MRQKRVEFEGAIYHVMQRGNNKEKIFLSDADKKFFIAELANSKKKYGFKLFGFVLLDNHYHLLIQTGPIPLSKIMQRQNSLFSRYHNRVHERIDHLFGLRYKAILVEDERYLFSVLCYIHWNPVKAGLTRQVSDYKWSSDVFYRRGKSGLADVDYICNIISRNRQHAVKEYLRLIQDHSNFDQDLQEITGDIAAADLFDLFEEERQRKKELDSILSETGLNHEQIEMIKAGSRLRNLTPYKKSFVEEALRQGYMISEIAEHINVSIKAIYRLNVNK